MSWQFDQRIRDTNQPLHIGYWMVQHLDSVGRRDKRDKHQRVSSRPMRLDDERVFIEVADKQPQADGSGGDRNGDQANSADEAAQKIGDTLRNRPFSWADDREEHQCAAKYQRVSEQVELLVQ